MTAPDRGATYQIALASTGSSTHDGGDDRIGISGAIRRAWVIIGFLEEAIDGHLQIANRTKGATLEALPAQLGEEAFDRVEPGGRGRGEVKDETGMAAQPGPHLGMLMSGIIVEHHVDDPPAGV